MKRANKQKASSSIATGSSMLSGISATHLKAEGRALIYIQHVQTLDYNQAREYSPPLIGQTTLKSKFSDQIVIRVY